MLEREGLGHHFEQREYHEDLDEDPRPRYLLPPSVGSSVVPRRVAPTIWQPSTSREDAVQRLLGMFEQTQHAACVLVAVFLEGKETDAVGGGERRLRGAPARRKTSRATRPRRSRRQNSCSPARYLGRAASHIDSLISTGLAMFAISLGVLVGSGIVRDVSKAKSTWQNIG